MATTSYYLYGFIIILFLFQILLLFQVQKDTTPVRKFRVEEKVDEDSSNYSVCMVIPSILRLLSYVNYHVILWNDCIIVPVAVTSDEELYLEKYKSAALFPSRVTVVKHHMDIPHYPLNSLRNIGMRQSTSSHLLFANPSQIPSRFLYDAIFSIPSAFLSNPKRAHFIPEFTMKYSSVPCTFWYECEERAHFLSSINKAQLQSCSKWGECVADGNTGNSKYMFAKWYSLQPGNYTTPLYCWNEGQKGNILVKKSDALPLFEERIVDDTGHSTEWMMELYSQGFTFDVISQGWFVNIAMKVSVEMEKSTSPLKRSFGSSPGLINMIHASIAKRSKDMKKIPICICSCLFEQRTQNLNPLKQLVSENPRPHSLNYIDKGEYAYVSKSLRKGASSFFEISSYSLINKPKYLKEVLR